MPGSTRGASPVRETAGGRAVVPAAQDSVRPIAAIVGSDALVGRAVRIAGRCLGYGGGTAASGGPPRTRSDWQLADATGAVYVVGRRPTDCAREAGGARRVLVVGRVAEDTVRGLGASTPRRFVLADSVR